MTAALAIAADPNDPAVRRDLVHRAITGARIACGAGEAASYADLPRQVRQLAAAALFRGKYVPAGGAARDCAVGHQSGISGGHLARAEVSDAMINVVIAYLADGVVPLPPSEVSAPSPVPASPAGPAAKCKPMKRADKPHKATLRRFASAEIDPSQAVDLRADHPAVVEGRTLFPKSVVGTWESPRFLVSGHNNPKLGKAVTKGPRTGWPIFQITLEERATCPRSCPVWAGCYGNAMPFTRRHAVDEFFMTALRGEISTVSRQHPEGLLIRLHALGDFFSVEYVLMWAELLAAIPQLHVFGYTARREDDVDPESVKIARAIRMLTTGMWSRFSIRTSHPEFGPQRSVVVDVDPGLEDVIVCPAQTEKTECCASCGLCWAEAARPKTIAFLRHGMKSHKGRAHKNTNSPSPEGIAGPPAQATEAEEAAWPAVDSASNLIEPAPALAPEPVPALADLPLEAIGERLGLDAFRPQRVALTGIQRRDPAKLAHHQRADEARLLDTLIRLADGEVEVSATLAVLSEASGIPQGSIAPVIDRLVGRGKVAVHRSTRPGSRAPAPNVYVLASDRHATVVHDESPAEDRAPDPEPTAPAPRTPPAAAVLASPFRIKPRKAPSFVAPDRNVRLKAVGPDVIRWCSFYSAAGVAMDFLAFCFDVDEDDLAQAVRA